MAASAAHSALYARVRVLEAKFKNLHCPVVGDEVVDCTATEEVGKLIIEHFKFVPECEAIVASMWDKIQVIHADARAERGARGQGGSRRGHRDGGQHVEAAAKEKAGVAQRVAKEKLVVEKAAEQAAEVKAAKAKTHREQVEKDEAAAKVKVDAEMVAKASAAEELAAKEEQERSIAETAAMGDAEWLELFEYCLMTGQVVEADLEQGDPRRHQVWLAKKAGAETAEVKPQGSTVAEAAAVVLTAGKAAKQKPGEAAAKEQGVEEQAAKKAKVSKFDAVDMELEALAHRIDSMPSAAEARDWYSRGWR
jgi:hypothetical protein